MQDALDLLEQVALRSTELPVTRATGSSVLVARTL